jgi:DNA-binding response OmpR family regulator
VSTPPARRVLVVEDELAIRELLRLHLELAGFALEERERRAPCARRGTRTRVRAFRRPLNT